jgi:hypothetical protein
MIIPAGVGSPPPSQPYCGWNYGRIKPPAAGKVADLLPPIKDVRGTSASALVLAAWPIDNSRCFWLTWGRLRRVSGFGDTASLSPVMSASFRGSGLAMPGFETC